MLRMNSTNIFVLIMLLVTVSCAQNNINGNTLFGNFLKTALQRNSEVGPGGLTFPFTKWCGPGSTAQNFDDLGQDMGTDICCREHDHCDQGINTGHEMCRFKNNGFKISSCDCDERFKECLRLQNTVSSRVVTQIYKQFVRKCLFIDPQTGECDVRRRRF